MIRFVKHFISAGLALFLSLTADAIGRIEHETSTQTQPPICSDTSGLDPNTAAFVNLQCSIQSQLFPSAADATVIYQMQEEIQKPGDYGATGVLGQFAKLNVVWVQAANDIELPPGTNAIPGLRACVFAAKLSNASGTFLPVSGVAFTYKDQTSGSRLYGMMITQFLTQSDLDELTIDTRMQAGLRFVDSTTGTSYSLDSTLPGPILSAFANSTDISTIYCHFGNLPPGPGPVDLDCVKDKSLTYNNSARYCREVLAINTTAAFVSFATAVIACGGWTLVTPPLSFAGFALCVAIAAAALAIALAVILANYISCINTAKRQLIIDLRSCGVTVVEM
jgi:hypothetical protein